jgi:predicted phosphoribosyltransferase
MDRHVLFADRAEAGRRLANRLQDYLTEPVIVYALPRGGVPVAAEIAYALHAPLDLVLVRKIGTPAYPELALAAVCDGSAPSMVINEEIMKRSGASRDYLLQESRRQIAEIGRRRRLYFGDEPRPDPRGSTALIVDDGLATGATARVAVAALRERGAAKVVLAVPVSSAEAAALVKREVDEFVCLAESEDFQTVSSYYGDFHQLSDEEVLTMLAEAREFAPRQREPI